MKIESVRFSESAQRHMEYWAKNDPKVILKIQKLIESAMAHPGKGLGKPEKLSLDLAGFWSRRITHQHRLVYTVKGNVLFIIQARFHYSNK